MATAAAGRGEDNSPPRNESTNNGNIPAALLTESISDLNLGPAQVNRFLSAKNSVELHKSRGRRFFPNVSLPSVLDTEEPGHGSSSGPSTIPESPSPASEIDPAGSRSHSGRNVNWADLHPTPARQALTDSCSKVTKPQRSTSSFALNDPDPSGMFVSCSPVVVTTHNSDSKSSIRPVKTKETSSHTSLYLNSPDLAVEAISVLHGPTESRPFVTGQSSMYVDMEIGRDGPTIKKRHRNDDSKTQVQAQTFRGGSPVKTRSHEELMDETDRKSLIDDEDGLPKNRDTGQKQLGQNGATESVLTSGQVTDERKYLGYPVNLMTDTQDPVAVYHQMSTLPPILDAPFEVEEQFVPRHRDLGAEVIPHPQDNDYYTGDDEVDFDAKPELKFCLDDVPVPDPEYVASTVSPSRVPLIVRNCKKDCRTWLWKSREQREVALRLQAQDDFNGVSQDWDRSLPNNFPQGLTPRRHGSTLDFDSYYS